MNLLTQKTLWPDLKQSNLEGVRKQVCNLEYSIHFCTLSKVTLTGRRWWGSIRPIQWSYYNTCPCRCQLGRSHNPLLCKFIESLGCILNPCNFYSWNLYTHWKYTFAYGSLISSNIDLTRILNKHFKIDLEKRSIRK